PAFEQEIRSRSGMGVDPEWTYEPATREEVQAALRVIPAERYYDWLYCGAALFHEFGEGGRDLFFWWSSTSAKFDAAQCHAKWDECKKLTEHTVATIFHLANQHDPDWWWDFEEPSIEAPSQSVSPSARGQTPEQTVTANTGPTKPDAGPTKPKLPSLPFID